MNASTTTPDEFQRRERQAQFRWMGMILFFFIVQAILWIAAIWLTHNDASHAVVAGYDQQALHWDATRQAQQQSEALGWQATIEFVPDSESESGMIAVFLVDKSSQPLRAADVQLSAFHMGRASEVRTINLSEQEPGRYVAPLAIDRAGKWRITGLATTGDAQFMIEQTLLIESSKGQTP